MNKENIFTKLSQLTTKILANRKQPAPKEAQTQSDPAEGRKSNAFFQKTGVFFSRIGKLVFTKRAQARESAVSLFESIGGKLLLFVVPILIVAVTVSTLLATTSGNQISDRIMNEQMDRAFSSFSKSLEDQVLTWLETATESAVDPVFIKEVSAQNAEGIGNYLSDFQAGGSGFVFVTDRLGNILYSTSSYYRKGENLASAAYLQKAFEGRQDISLTADPNGNIYRLAAVPVKLERTGIVGCIVAGYYYNNAALLDKQKDLHGADFTVFKNDVRWATTITKNNVRIVGTQMDPHIADTPAAP